MKIEKMYVFLSVGSINWRRIENMLDDRILFQNYANKQLKEAAITRYRIGRNSI